MRHNSYFRFLGSLTAVLLLFGSALLVSGCSGNNSNPSDGDEEVDLIDPEPEFDEEEIEYPLCTPETLRCADNEFMEKCNSRGDTWVLYRRCALDEYCDEGECFKFAVDGDESDVVDEAADNEDGNMDNEELEDEEEDALPPECVCPGHPEMARVVDPDTGDEWCIDKYEATVFENPDCTGRVYGQDWGDWPDDYPKCIGCTEDIFADTIPCNYCDQEDIEGNIGASVYACSLPLVNPSDYTTFLRAYYACRHSGKMLCSYFQWHSACTNGGATTYPYGDKREVDACNLREYNPTYKNKASTPRETGAFPLCTNDCFVYDLLGNWWEHAYTMDDDAKINELSKVGGSFAHFSSNSTEYDTTCNANTIFKSSLKDIVAFRCCIPLP